MLPSEAAFDAYYKWLGIPVQDQPPDHYRLLAIPLFTNDADVIANAADQRMGHVRTFQAGQHSALSQKLLNEISQARLCLLNSEKKAAYDQALRAQLAAKKAASAPTIPPHEAGKPILSDAVSVSPSAYSPYSPKRLQQRKGKSLQLHSTKVIAGSVAGLALGYLILCWLVPPVDFLGMLPTSVRVASRSGDDRDAPKSPPTKTTGSNSKAPKTIVQRPEAPPKQKLEPDERIAAEIPAASVPASEPQPVTRSTPDPGDEKANRRQSLEKDMELAISRTDVETAWQAIEAIVALDGGDALGRKWTALQRMKTSIASTLFVERQLQLIEQAVTDDRKNFADEHVDELLSAARKLDNRYLARRATLCVLKVQQMKAP